MKVRQLQEILQLNKENFTNSVEFQVEVVSIYADIDPEEIWEWPKDKLNKYFNTVKLILNASSSSSEVLELNDYTFYKIPFNKLTLGSYIDLEYYSSEPDGLVKMIAILYRQKYQENSISEIVYEPYKNWIEERLPLFLEANVADVVGIKSEYLTWRTNLIKHYNGLFDSETEEPDEDDLTDELGRINAMKIRKMEEQRKQFNWENIILKLCNGDATKFESCLEIPVVLFFNILSSIKIHESK